MAAILIVENDRQVAGYLAHTMREAGHTPIIASDACSALQGAMDCPDIVLFDLGLPDITGEELLQLLKSRPETAQIPVLVITGKREAATQLRESGKAWKSDILLKPVSEAQLRQAVDAALVGQQELDADALRLAQERQGQLVQRLIVEGPDPLVFHTCRRLSLDRLGGRGSLSGEALTWADIAEWAKQERLLDAEEAHLLRRIPLARPRKARERPA
jgi:DNA-binding response OmpR family regulator